MKKKLFAIIAVMAMIMGCTACGSNTADNKVHESESSKMESVISTEVESETESESESETESKAETKADADKKSDDKKDSKSEDKTTASNKTENKSETKSDNKVTNSTANAGNSTSKPASNNNNSSTTKPSSGSNNGSTGNKNNNSSNSSNTGSNNNKPAESKPVETKPVHNHDFKAVYKTVHHDEVGHWETVVVKEAWTENIEEAAVICNGCGKNFGSGSDAVWAWSDHCDEQEDMGITTCGGYHTEHRVINTINHPAETKQEWKVDKKAYNEQVIDHYECSCGTRK